jgi:hypothetical protein
VAVAVLAAGGASSSPLSSAASSPVDISVERAALEELQGADYGSRHPASAGQGDDAYDDDTKKARATVLRVAVMKALNEVRLTTKHAQEMLE